MSGPVVAPFDGEGAGAAWDAFVRSASGWTHFHLWGWRRVIERTHGHECLYLAATGAGGRLEGVLPLVRVKSRLFGHYLVSMPFLNYGGPLGSAEAVRALADEAVRLADRDGVKLLELRSREPLAIDLPVSHRKITVVLDLAPGNPEGVFAKFPAKLRSQVRRPAKEGVAVRFGRDQVAPFFAVFARHMRDLGTPTQPRALFEAIADEFGDDAWFACAYLGDVPIACGAGFRWNGELEMTWASALVAYNKLSPNMALYWAFIERAAEERLTLFNFGRCSPGSGTHKFKLQWGGRDVPLHWYQRAAGGRGGDAHTPSPDDGAYAWGPKLWARLPVPLATALGPRIVRGIP
ncbi:MAG TPA: FemAB family XrtA/PEP-CTERM system-associated protein [Gemmatimonadales bacterium]|nr:FemAB family XrtA/PEP-CTERM system-associated protein [Gemmatimonadales bacterium]